MSLILEHMLLKLSLPVLERFLENLCSGGAQRQISRSHTFLERNAGEFLTGDFEELSEHAQIGACLMLEVLLIISETDDELKGWLYSTAPHLHEVDITVRNAQRFYEREAEEILTKNEHLETLLKLARGEWGDEVATGILLLLYLFWETERTLADNT